MITCRREKAHERCRRSVSISFGGLFERFLLYLLYFNIFYYL